MPDTVQTQCVNLAVNIINTAQALRSLRNQWNQIVDEYNKLGASTVWSAMATAALNADGSIGTADGTSNTAHPITVGNIYRSESDLVSGIVMFQQLQNFFANSAVTTGDYLSTLSKMAGV